LFDVDQGDATLLEGREAAVLIDAGNSLAARFTSHWAPIHHILGKVAPLAEQVVADSR
jgi:hypothetical protein